jgi:small-conductance mechanosensitive channel
MKQFLKYELLKYGSIEIKVLSLLVICIILLAAFTIYKLVKKVLKRGVDAGRIDEGRKFAVSQMLKYLLYVIVIAMSLNAIGIDVTIFIAGSAALLVGLGLGIKQIFSDIVSGIILLIEGELKVGDVVEANEIIGVVRKIGIRTSKVLTSDSTIMIVPNSKFVSETVINWSHHARPARFHIDIGIPYTANVETVKQVVLAAAAANEDIEKNPTAFVRLENYGETMLLFRLYFFSKKVINIESVKGTLREIICERLLEKDIAPGADKKK